MDINQFKKLIENFKEVSDKERSLYDMKVDLFDFVNEYHAMITYLLIALYGKANTDWIHWYCYENDFGRGSLKAYDENDKEILNTIDELYNFINNGN